MRFNLSRRIKLISGIVVGLVLILSGTIFGLAKTGTININMLADEVVKTVGLAPKAAGANVVLNVNATTANGGSANGQVIRLYQKSAPSVNLGTEIANLTLNSTSIAIFNLKSGGIYDVACDNGPISPALNITPDGSLTNISTSVMCPNIAPPTECPAGQHYDDVQKKCVPDSSGSMSFAYRIETYCTDCPNRNSNSGLVKDIPIFYGDVEEQLSAIPPYSNYSSQSGYFENVPVGNIVFTINSSSSSHYNSAYETLIMSRDVTYNSTGVFSTAFVLKKNSALPPVQPVQTETFDLQGIVKDQNSKILPGVNVTAFCPETPTAERDKCQVKRINGVEPTTTSYDPTQKTHNSEQNFLINLYNIARVGAEVTSYRVAFSKPGYYYDKNGNKQQDAGEDRQIVTFDNKKVISPEKPELNSYYAMTPDVVLSEGVIKIAGKVTKSATEGATPLKDANLELTDLSGGSGSIVVKKSITDGTYSFAGLVSSRKYRITCRFDGRTTQSREVTAISGQDTNVDFVMNPNVDFQYGGYVKGFIYSGDGANTPAKNASVALYRIVDNKKILYKKVFSDNKGAYSIKLDPKDLFVTEGNGIVGADYDFRLQAGAFFPLQKNHYDFKVHWREGVVYEQDVYLAYDSPGRAGKSVDVTVYQEVRDYADGKVISSTKAVGVPVWLTQSTGGGEEDPASTVLYSSSIKTNKSGVSRFNPLDRVLFNVGIEPASGFIIDSAKSQLNISKDGTTANVYIWRKNIPNLSTLSSNIDQYYYSQDGGNWANTTGVFNRPGNSDDGTTANNDVGKVGCCLTSITMAMNYYMHQSGIDPKLVANYFKSHGYNANLSFEEQWASAVKDISGGKLTISIVKEGAPGWSAIKSQYIDKGIPVVVHSNNWGGHGGSMGHCVFIHGMTNDQVTFFDPKPGDSPKNRSQSFSSVGINTVIIIKPVNSTSFGAIFAPFAASLVDSVKAANSTISNGSKLSLATTLSNPSKFQVAAVYAEKFVNNKFVKRYRMSLSSGKYKVTIPGYDNTTSFKYRYSMVDGLGVAHPGEFNTVTVSTASVPASTRAINSVEKVADSVTSSVSRFFTGLFSK